MKNCFLALIITLFVTNCTINKPFSNGNDAYKHHHYETALKLYEEEYNENKLTPREKSNIAYKIAQTLIKQNKYSEAERWVDESIRISPSDDANKLKGFLLKSSGDYNKALQHFKLMKKISSGASEYTYYQNEINSCNFALSPSKQKYIIDSSQSITENTTIYDEYLVFNDGKQFIFCQPKTADDKIDPWNNNGFTDLIQSGNLNLPDINLLNEAYHEGSFTYNPSNKLAIITKCGYNDDQIEQCNLYSTKNQDNSWSTPELLPFQKKGYSYRQASWHPKQSILAYVSNENNENNFDIYIVSLTEDNSWKYPSKLASNINTPQDEAFPSFHNNKLYFSSAGHINLGGLDIFSANATKSILKWKTPQNLGSSINSPKDDFMWAPINDSVGYFNSNRTGTDDIFVYKKNMIPTPTEKEVVHKISLLITVKTSNKNITPFTYNNINSTSDRPIIITDLSANESIDLAIEANNYYNQSVTFNTFGINNSKLSRDTILRHTITLEPIITGQEIELEDIYYDLDKWEIRKDAFEPVEQLYTILDNNPSINIELLAHTDCRGSEKYNKELSQKRANSVRSYLIKKGINQNRITAIGMGENYPKTLCECKYCTEEQHQMNRRTTFKVIKK